MMGDYEGTGLDTVSQMIGTGIGLAFLPARYVRSEIGPRHDVEVLELDETPMHREEVLAWRPSAPQRQLYRAMATFLRAQCRKKLGDILHVAEG
jgi:LysR family hydrogen peroxide-inducible transcriptional activator